MNNPYLDMVQAAEKQLRDGKSLPRGGFPCPAAPVLDQDAPVVLLFSPHPDDECITGGLPLRLRRELKMNVVNVAVTQGSNKARQPGRLNELRQACAYLGFGVMTTRENGLEKVNVKCREGEPAVWKGSVALIARILGERKPHTVVFPHASDANSTHIGTHHLVMDSLAALGSGFSCFVVETEFWSALPNPNLMIESGAADVADLIAATSFHAGEVARNPYHLRLTAWMSDNVRRGGELVGGQGGAAPDFAFATLYRLSRWQDGALAPVVAGGRQFTARADLGAMFAP